LAAIVAGGSDGLRVRCGLRSKADCEGAVERIMAEYGHIDILSNNAGVTIRKDSAALEEDEWDLLLDVTLKAVYLLSREVIPNMIAQGGGSIINTGSGWSLQGGPKAASNCAAKGGVLNLTRAMAIDLGRHNIRVNCVCPGDVDTPMLASECQQLGEDRLEFMKDAANRPIAWGRNARRRGERSAVSRQRYVAIGDRHAPGCGWRRACLAEAFEQIRAQTYDFAG
jgi:NAD(P)-dependent dehydrogenase (short-subunit alcohol dehydrogenase family)